MNSSSKFDIPNIEKLPKDIKEPIRQLCEGLRRNHDGVYADIAAAVTQLPVNAVAPSVKNGHKKLFYTANTSATVYTDFLGAEEGQEIDILCLDTNTSISDGGNFKLSSNWTPNADDMITIRFKSGIWYEKSRSAN